MKQTNFFNKYSAIAFAVLLVLPLIYKANLNTFSSYFAAFFLVGFVFEGLAFAVFFAALASAISANTFSIRRI